MCSGPREVPEKQRGPCGSCFEVTPSTKRPESPGRSRLAWNLRAHTLFSQKSSRHKDLLFLQNCEPQRGLVPLPGPACPQEAVEAPNDNL